MTDERRGRSGELEIGGFGLLALGLLALGLCAASFWLGRWSVQAGVGVAADERSAADGPVENGGDLEAELTFFDRLERAPELSAQGGERTVLGASAPEDAPSGEAAAEGPYQIQVLASAERSAAEAVLARLGDRGYRVRMIEGRKDGRPIYRVRVGGYPDEAAARRAAAALEEQEGLRTWITR